MLTNKLINPTHRDVKFPYDRGIKLHIPSDGEVELSMEQMDDFRPGKPGSEEVRKQLDYFGLFLLDGDRSYDEQALASLKASVKSREDQYRAFTQRLRDSRISTGSPVTEEAMEEACKQAGYDSVAKDIETLQKRIKILTGVIDASGATGRVKEDLDPKRTCFATQPPRQFPSETALMMFLSEKDEDFVEAHTAMQKAALGEE